MCVRVCVRVDSRNFFRRVCFSTLAIIASSYIQEEITFNNTPHLPLNIVYTLRLSACILTRSKTTPIATPPSSTPSCTVLPRARVEPVASPSLAVESGRELDEIQMVGKC